MLHLGVFSAQICAIGHQTEIGSACPELWETDRGVLIHDRREVLIESSTLSWTALLARRSPPRGQTDNRELPLPDRLFASTPDKWGKDWALARGWQGGLAVGQILLATCLQDPPDSNSPS